MLKLDFCRGSLQFDSEFRSSIFGFSISLPLSVPIISSTLGVPMLSVQVLLGSSRLFFIQHLQILYFTILKFVSLCSYIWWVRFLLLAQWPSEEFVMEFSKEKWECSERASLNLTRKTDASQFVVRRLGVGTEVQGILSKPIEWLTFYIPICKEVSTFFRRFYTIAFDMFFSFNLLGLKLINFDRVKHVF